MQDFIQVRCCTQMKSSISENWSKNTVTFRDCESVLMSLQTVLSCFRENKTLLKEQAARTLSLMDRGCVA